MISFIIIGRNEGIRLEKCFKSIYATIEHNKIKSYQVIYVDSDSGDNSIEIVKSFNNVTIIRIEGEINAAIARNEGAKFAQGDVLYFVDGDMELLPDFLGNVYNEEAGLNYEFTSGYWRNYYYNLKNDLINVDPVQGELRTKFNETTGGLFLISKKLWEYVNGMNNRYKKAQDHDLAIRLSKLKKPLLKIGFIAANHHTVSYFDKNRFWRDLIDGNYLYSRSFLYRSHIFNRRIYVLMIRNDYTALILVFGLISFSIFDFNFLFFFMIYFLTLLIRTKFRFVRFLNIAIRDVQVVLGFFLFFPQKTFQYRVEIIKKSL